MCTTKSFNDVANYNLQQSFTLFKLKLKLKILDFILFSRKKFRQILKIVFDFKYEIMKNKAKPPLTFSTFFVSHPNISCYITKDENRFIPVLPKQKIVFIPKADNNVLQL